MEARGGDVRVDVSDTGNGIAAGFPAPRLRAVPPGRRQLDAHARRPRAGALDRPAPRRAARRPHDGRQRRRRTGIDILGVSPGPRSRASSAGTRAGRAASARTHARSRGHARADRRRRAGCARAAARHAGRYRRAHQRSGERRRSAADLLGRPARHHPGRRRNARPGWLRSVARDSQPRRRRGGARARHCGLGLRAARRQTARAQSRLQRSHLQAGAARRSIRCASSASGCTAPPRRRARHRTPRPDAREVQNH